MLNSPIYCLTCDVDWASEDALRGFIDLASRFGIRPTIFATHQSQVLADAMSAGIIDLGIHPNFLPGSTHGDDVPSVIDFLCGLYPEAVSFRSHSFVDSTPITAEMVARGFTHDSNLALYMQPGLEPLRHASGLVRFPVFWEDDVHWAEAPGEWDVERMLPHFLTPGLKVINVHPFLVAANLPSGEMYRAVKHEMTTADQARLEAIRHNGPGVGTFLEGLLKTLTERGERFLALGEAYVAFAPERATPATGADAGRVTAHTDEEYEQYWAMSDFERQQQLRDDYERRNPLDPYATSRDVQLRELEITAISRLIVEPGHVLDLGCGNGYTLLSLARDRAGWCMTGIDFSPNLIAGANALLDQQRDRVQSVPTFECADAIEFMKEAPDAAYDYVLTERFLQNLPSQASQRDLLSNIFRSLRPGGVLVMCEGEIDGFDVLNDVRAATGLTRIPATSKDNLSAIRFSDAEIKDLAGALGFVVREKQGFSTFFAISRVLHPLLTAPLSPRFDAPINGLARTIQEQVPFEPGLGSNVLWVLEKPSGEQLIKTNCDVSG